MTNEKTMTNFEQAVFLEQALILNGFLANGTPMQKQFAKKEWAKLQQQYNFNPTEIVTEQPFL